MPKSTIHYKGQPINVCENENENFQYAPCQKRGLAGFLSPTSGAMPIST
jgi:hypothetical protein